MKGTGSVVLLGDINIDAIMPIKEYPAPGGEGIAERVDLRVGGSVANTAFVLAKLGTSTRIIGSTGDSLWAEMAQEQLSEVGVDLTWVVKSVYVSTGLNFIAVTPDGERTMFGYRGANAALKTEKIKREAFEDVSVLHLSGYAFLESPQREAAWRAVELAQERQIPVSLDTSQEAALRQPVELRQLLPDLDVCVLGMEEAESLTGAKNPDEAIDDLLNKGVRLIGLKFGGSGCLLADSTQRRQFPIFRVDTVDTTGAGDAFSAGILYGWMEEMSMLAIGTLASALGALATTVQGGGVDLPGRDDALSYLRSIKDGEEATAFGSGVGEVITALERIE